MRLRPIFILLSWGILLTGCWAKKKRSYAQNKAAYQQANAQRTLTPNIQAAKGSTAFVFNSPEEYIAIFAPIAIEEMEEYGIPASITLAQGLLESGAGQSNLVKKSNNHFGIKCHTQWRGPSTRHDDDKKKECFRKYIHPRESYRDHSLFLVNGNRYAFLFNYKITDYKSWARGLKKAGYATDPKYSSKLIKKIQTYRLDQYDQPKLAKRLSRRSKFKGKVAPQEKAQNQTYHKVQKGDTLYSISKKYKTSVAQLKAINGLKSNAIQIGDQLKISSK